MKHVALTVDHEHVASFASVRKPINAIEELIWNSLDADASKIEIHTEIGELDSLRSITIRDNGTGIYFDELQQAFGTLGGSKKAVSTVTQKGRLVHGKLGRGRFSAFGLGDKVSWISTFSGSDNIIRRYKVTGVRHDLTSFDVTEPTIESDAPTGVTVRITDIAQNFSSLMNPDDASEELSKRLAMYLRKYPGISIDYDGRSLDSSHLESSVDTYDLNVTSRVGTEYPVELTVIEWKKPAERAMYFCNSSGFAVEEKAPGIQAPGYHFTAYIKSPIVDTLVNENAFAAGDLHPDVLDLTNSVKNTLRTHFRKREAARSVDLVKDWKDQKIYPYHFSEKDPIKLVEQEVFDICALKVHQYLPNFDKSDLKNKALTFKLIRESLEMNPEGLQRILSQILALPKEQQDDLARLLDRTQLTAIINAARTVVDRLDFLSSLNSILYGVLKETTLERRHLQRILIDELWVFGEKYNLGVDDESLTRVLEEHISFIGRDSLIGDDKLYVTDLDGRRRIVDIMLSAQVPLSDESHYEHLVIELKRPTCKLGRTEISQIEDYAFAVAKDERFDKELTKWTFLLVGNKLDDFADMKCRVQGRQYGHIHASEDGKVNIHVKPWSSVLSEARWRYTFFKDKLQIQVTDADGLEYLRRKHSSTGVFDHENANSSNN